jgi:hypothetical protein
MNETSGVLAPVVRKYLEGGELEPGELGTMRAYLRQWVNAPGFVGADVERLRGAIDGISSTIKLRVWIADAMNAGIDPL